MKETAATVVTNTCVAPEHEAEFAAWQAEMNKVVERFPGFDSWQVIPPFPPAQVDWVIVQRFTTPDQARRWLESSERADMLKRIQPVLVGEDSINVFVGSGAPGPSEETTAVIMTQVAAHREADFRDWQRRLDAAQSKFPGYLGCELQAPVPGFQEHFVTMLRFDSADHLSAWLKSPEREALMAESRPYVEKSVIRQARNGFGNWFAFGAQRQGMAPAWKNNYIVLLGLYPIVMLEILFLNPFLAWMPVSLSNFIGNIISVGVLGWPVIWLLSKWMAWWLAPVDVPTPRRDVGGAILVLAIIAIMGLVFYAIGFPVAQVKSL
ncbi:MAG: antibiotic biosynthesis monooxygenase [Chloroflexota bacterium]